MIHEETINGLTIRTGDIICTDDGAADSVVGRLWQALGHAIPGEVDHTLLYVGPAGRCVEAGPRGVIVYNVPGEHWDSEQLVDERWMRDTPIGVAYPLADQHLAGERADHIRAQVAEYCLAQAGTDKPYNFNFFDPETDKAFYCSQLIYKAYLEQGIDLTHGADTGFVHEHTPVVLPQLIWETCVTRRFPT